MPTKRPRSLLLLLFLTGLFFLPPLVQSAEAAGVHVFVHRADGTGYPGGTIRITNLNTGAFIAQQPTAADGWVHFNLPLQWMNTYRVDPLVSTCPYHADFQHNGWDRYFYFRAQPPTWPCN